MEATNSFDKNYRTFYNSIFRNVMLDMYDIQHLLLILILMLRSTIVLSGLSSPPPTIPPPSTIGWRHAPKTNVIPLPTVVSFFVSFSPFWFSFLHARGSLLLSSIGFSLYLPSFAVLMPFLPFYFSLFASDRPLFAVFLLSLFCLVDWLGFTSLCLSSLPSRSRLTSRSWLARARRKLRHWRTTREWRFA